MSAGRVILGTMTFGPEGTNGARITSVEGTEKVLDCFKERGYSELDTAGIYCEGKTEEYLRNARYKENGFKIATKVYPTETGIHRPEILRAKFEQSLQTLGQDSVDIFYLHVCALCLSTEHR